MNSSMTAMYIYIYADTNMFCLLMTAPVKTACPTREHAEDFCMPKTFERQLADSGSGVLPSLLATIPLIA